MTKEERNAHQSVYSNLSTSKLPIPAGPSAAQELEIDDCLCEGGKGGYLKRKKKKRRHMSVDTAGRFYYGLVSIIIIIISHHNGGGGLWGICTYKRQREIPDPVKLPSMPWPGRCRLH